MKTLIASDIHGSALYCSMLIDRFRVEKCNDVILLGDILYHGPRNDLPVGYSPKQVIELLNPISDCITCVRGNCDAEVDNMVLNFDVLIESRDIKFGNIKIHLTHGHRENPDNIPDKQFDVMLFGHTHVPLCAEEQGRLLLNPGSVSIPKSGSPNSYAVFDDKNGLFIWKTLSGEEYMRCQL